MRHQTGTSRGVALVVMMAVNEQAVASTAQRKVVAAGVAEEKVMDEWATVAVAMVAAAWEAVAKVGTRVAAGKAAAD